MCVSKTKPRVGIHPDSLHHYPIPNDPFSSLAIDVLELKPVTVNGAVYDFFMVLVCRLTGYVIAVA